MVVTNDGSAEFGTGAWPSKDTLSPPPPIGVELAGMGRRLAARLIDIFLVCLCGFLAIGFLFLFFFLVIIAAVVAVPGANRHVVVALMFLPIIAAVATFEPACIHWWGGTPGKLMLGIRVVSQERFGGRPGWRASFVRSIFFPPTSFPLNLIAAMVPFGGAFWLMVVAAPFPALFSPDRRGIHDMMANTWVVRRR